ncbi:UNVERIFIED_CONTAM: hypothetical protein GTU68_064958 [Idotea baltica]|nr:hypothetical protein [Idotea baltica]
MRSQSANSGCLSPSRTVQPLSRTRGSKRSLRPKPLANPPSRTIPASRSMPCTARPAYSPRDGRKTRTSPLLCREWKKNSRGGGRHPSPRHTLSRR